jgi:hypothetical protein
MEVAMVPISGGFPSGSGGSHSVGTVTATYEMERAIACLGLELDGEVWEDIRDKWHTAKDALVGEMKRLLGAADEWKQIALDLERGSVEVTDGMVDDWVAVLRSGNKVIFGHPQATGLADYIEELRHG